LPTKEPAVFEFARADRDAPLKNVVLVRGDDPDILLGLLDAVEAEVRSRLPKVDAGPDLAVECHHCPCYGERIACCNCGRMEAPCRG
jgi:hypothetical protein